MVRYNPSTLNSENKFIIAKLSVDVSVVRNERTNGLRDYRLLLKNRIATW